MTLRCKATTKAGKPCQARDRFVDPDTMLCTAHADPEEMARRGRKGAEATAAKLRGQDGLEEGELGPLETYADCKRWLAIVGEATSTGRLRDRPATAIIRAVSEWIKCHSEEATSGVVEELEAEVKRLQSDMKNRSVTPLRQVDAGS